MEAEEACFSTSPESPTPKKHGVTHPGATRHQGGLAQAVAGNLQLHVSRNIGCVFFLQNARSGAVSSVLGPERWFCTLAKKMESAAPVPVFGGPPQASFPCASTGNSVFTHTCSSSAPCTAQQQCRRTDGGMCESYSPLTREAAIATLRLKTQKQVPKNILSLG